MTVSDVIEKFDEWENSRLECGTKRSRLYKLQPYGIGTPLVEGLSSYIARLAIAHSVQVRTLIRKEIIPHMNNRVKITNFSYYNFHLLNGTSETTKHYISILERLTSLENLLPLTMTTWAEVIAPTQLLSPQRRWCPHCLDEWSKTDNVYEPLIWSLRVIHFCPIHHVPLIDSCPYPDCIRHNSNKKKYKPGFCFDCDRWLGKKIGLKSLNPTIDYEHNCILESVGRLLTLAGSMSTIASRDQFSASLRKIIRALISGPIDNFSRTIGISQSSLWMWFKGRNIPQLDTLLKICISLGITIDLIFTSSNDSIKPNYGDGLVYRSEMLQRKVKRNDYESIAHKLQCILESTDPTPLSITQVCQMVGCSRPMLRDYFPDEFKALKDNYNKNIGIRKSDRMNSFKQRIRQTVIDLHLRGIYPSIRNVQSALGIRHMSYNQEYVRAWREIMDEIRITRRVN